MVEPAPFGEISVAVAALSAMLTPALLILAAGSILGTTSGRLGRVIDRVRMLARSLEAVDRSEEDAAFVEERRQHLEFLMQNAAVRTRVLQRAMSWLILSIAGFVMTSVAIGILELSGVDLGGLALLLGLISAALLLTATFFLLRESRIALVSVAEEMDFVLRNSRRRQAGRPS